MPQRAVDDEVGGAVGDLEDEGEPARDVRDRAARRDAVVRAVEDLRREVADGEDDHHDDDDARHAVLVARRRRRGRRGRVAAAAARRPHGRATPPLRAVDAYQQQAEDRQDEKRQNERHHRVQDVRVDATKARLTPEFRKVESEKTVRRQSRSATRQLACADFPTGVADSVHCRHPVSRGRPRSGIIGCCLLRPAYSARVIMHCQWG